MKAKTRCDAPPLTPRAPPPPLVVLVVLAVSPPPPSSLPARSAASAARLTAPLVRLTLASAQWYPASILAMQPRMPGKRANAAIVGARDLMVRRRRAGSPHE